LLSVGLSFGFVLDLGSAILISTLVWEPYNQSSLSRADDTGKSELSGSSDREEDVCISTDLDTWLEPDSEEDEA
jgi:hypothetical protein